MFTSSKYILFKKFNRKFFRNIIFRTRLTIVAINEIYLINNWREFRKKFNKLHVLRNRLLIIVLYFDIFIILNLNILKTIKKNTSFKNCRLIKISIDYLEIN